jgi:hypothetical protein
MIVKSKYILIYICSLLLASLFPTTVYGDESSQTVGNDNNCPTQIINSNVSEVNCTIYIDHSKATPSVNQPNSGSETENPASSTHLTPSGYKPEQIPSVEISALSGYKPETSPPVKITSPSGYKPETSPPLEITQP